MNKTVKGIILAGGFGSRLYPLTKGVSKHLLPVYDKPMIYYPLSVLMNAGIRNILLISTSRDLPMYQELLGDGSHIGLDISYKIQHKPNGIAEAFIIANNFIGESNTVLILGDNIFHGNGFEKYLSTALKNLEIGFSSILGVKVKNPNNYGVVKFTNNYIDCIVEKPREIISNTIVSGLYFYTNEVKEVVKSLEYSDRGELEITDINNIFLKMGKLKLIELDKNISWLDTGTYDSLLEASKYFQDIEIMSGKKIACIEKIALKNNLIDIDNYLKIARSMSKSNYGKYLLNNSSIED